MLAYVPSSSQYTRLGVRGMNCWVSLNWLEVLVMRVVDGIAAPTEVYEAVDIQVEIDKLKAAYNSHLNSHSFSALCPNSTTVSTYPFI
jgi:hypothetical protein